MRARIVVSETRDLIDPRRVFSVSYRCGACSGSIRPTFAFCPTCGAALDPPEEPSNETESS